MDDGEQGGGAGVDGTVSPAAVEANASRNAGRDAPLSPREMAQLLEGSRLRRKIESARKAATFNGATAAIIGALALPFATISTVALVMGLVLVGVAVVEFIGRSMLGKVDLRAPWLLAGNQVFFCLVIIAYCVHATYTGIHAPSPHFQQTTGDPHVDQLLREIVEWRKPLVVVIYSIVALGAIVFQGGMAWYYISRLRLLKHFRAVTPRWVIDVQDVVLRG